MAILHIYILFMQN